jgi:hypothetical protein
MAAPKRKQATLGAFLSPPPQHPHAQSSKDKDKDGADEDAPVAKTAALAPLLPAPQVFQRADGSVTVRLPAGWVCVDQSVLVRELNGPVRHSEVGALWLFCVLAPRSQV